MLMLHNRTMIRQATVFAAAMASACLPVTNAIAATSSHTQVIDIQEFRALRQSAAWNALRAKLQRWKNLPLDWDGDDGIAPSNQTIDACSAFLCELEFFEAPIPVATIAGDGEITYEWAKDDGFASASLTADGHLIAFLREPGSTAPLRTDEPFTGVAIQPFLDRIGAFA